MSDRNLHENTPTGLAGRGETEDRVMGTYRRLAAPQPPATLDARVLASARRNGPARRRKLPAVRRHWIMPLGLAASALLAISLVLDTLQEPRGPTVPEQSLDGRYPGRPGSPARARIEAPDPGPASAGAASVQADSAVPARSAEKTQSPTAIGPREPEKLELRERRGNAAEMKSSEPPALEAEDWMVLVRSQLARGEVDGARRELERLLAQYPDRTDARQLLESLSLESP